MPGPLPITPKRAQRVVLSGDVPSSSPRNYVMDLDGSSVQVWLTHEKSDRERTVSDIRSVHPFILTIFVAKADKTKALADLATEFEHFKEEWKQEKVQRAREMEGLMAWKEELEDERAREEQLVACWETYIRIAQGEYWGIVI